MAGMPCSSRAQSVIRAKTEPRTLAFSPQSTRSSGPAPTSLDVFAGNAPLSSKRNASDLASAGCSPLSEAVASNKASRGEAGCRPLLAIYRLRLMTPEALSPVNRTVWLVPWTIMCITPEIEYSLL